MKMGIHEAADLNEILSSEVCNIEHHALYASQANDPQLRSILERHKNRMIQDYNAALNLMRGRGVRIDAYHARDVQNIQYGMHAGHPTVPHPDANRLNDRTIATGALLFHKCGAVSSMRSSLEMTDPDMRQFLTNKSITCNNMAYEIFQWMNQKGFYQVPVLEQPVMQQMQQMFSPVTTPAGGFVPGVQGPLV